MEISPPLVADRQSTKTREPGQRSFDHPAMPSEPLARVDAPAGDAREDAALAAGGPTTRVIVPLVRVQFVRTAARAAPPSARLPNRRNGIQHDLQPLRVMDIGRRKPHRERDSVGVDHKMSLRARFATIRWIRAGRFAPLFAATLAESSEARDQSSLSASARRCSRVWWRRSHTPARCQSRSRRQQVIPLPHPSSCGNISHVIPLLRTNKMPVNTARSLTRGRPPLGLGRSWGRSGSTTAHSSSLTSGLLMPPV